MFKSFVLKATPTGAAGSAGVTISKGIPAGRVVGYAIDYTTQPATTDVTLTAEGQGGTKTLYQKNNANTDVPLTLTQEQAKDSAGAAITGAYGSVVVAGGTLKLVVAQGDPVTDGVIVTVVMEI